MITPSFSITATERVLPKLALDFTTASLDSRVTFTRTGNTATVTNSNGYVANINADLPRFDYDPVALTCKGLLIEEARTNIQTYSEDFTNAIWTLTSATISSNVETSPANTLTGDKFILNNSATPCAIRTNPTLADSTVYSFSVYLKAAGFTNEVYLVFYNKANTFHSSKNINLANGTLSGSDVVCTTSISAAGNGWYRVTISGLNSATGATTPNIRIITYKTGNGTDGYFVWGAQLEAGTFPTSYIPTVATSVTRNADVATMTGTNFSSWYNASEGAFVAQANSYTLTAKTIVSANDATNNNIVSVTTDATTGIIRGAITTGGSGQTSGIGISSIVVNTTFKAAIAYKENSAATGGNGLSSATDTTITLPTVNQLTIGTRASAQQSVNGWLQKIAYYPQRISNAELAAFTK